MLSLFDLTSSSPVNVSQFFGSSIIPEPVFLITIEPVLTNGSNTTEGNSLTLYLDGQATLVDSIQIQVGDLEQITSLSYQGITVATLSNVFVNGFDCGNFLFEGDTGADLDLTVTNVDLNNDGYDLSSPLVDLFREGDIVRISMGVENLFTSNQNVDLYIGSINNIVLDYNNKGFRIAIKLENFLSILSRSAAVQTSNAQELDDQFLNPITAQVYNFDNLLNKLLSETIIPQAITSTNSAPSIIYYGGITDGVAEIEAAGNEGSAISPNSNIYAFTPPTDNKLNVILQTLYAYQRIFYIDNSGNFNITPLQNFFDENENWRFGMDGTPDLIPLSNIRIEKNTSNIQNRTFISILNIFLQFQQSNESGSNNKSNAYSVATTESDYFPRVVEFVKSGKYLQTLFGTQEINENLVQNSGLLNIATNFNNIQGLTSIISIDGNQEFITSGSELDPVKYFTALYAAKNLAEQLFNETRIIASVPVNLTYNISLSRFRNIPLNQLVYVPPVTNNIFDGIQQYFCYGYRMTYNRNDGANMDLYLTKPFTYCALWADSVEIIS